MKKYISLLTALFCASGLFGASFSIILPDSPTAAEKTAATELTTYLQKTAARQLRVNGVENIVFHIGNTKFANDKKIFPATMPDEQWLIRSFNRDIVIAGGGSRGTLYGVYNFLEKFCGIRWWNPTEEYVPATYSLSLPALDISGKPSYIYRCIYRWPLHHDQGRFAARNRINHDGPYPIDSSFGGAFYYGPPKHVHTFDEYIPVGKYMQQHPEYFALVGDVRKGGNFLGQLCLSNPDVLKVFLKQLQKNIRSGKRVAAFNNTAEPLLFDISQNDDAKPCSCPNCLKEIEKYGFSGQILRFVNALAAEIKKTNPKVMLTTLAYGYSLPPPKCDIKAASNVIVKVCRHATNAAVSINAPGNKEFADILRSWKKHADNIFVWDYAVSYWDGTKGLPFASELAYGDKHRFYRDNNVTGLFWEHEFPHVADMYDLKVYLEAKLMETPQLDADALTKEFMDKYYGKAARHILDYRKRIDKAMHDNNGFIGGNPRLCTFGYLDDATLIECHAIMNKAENAVKADKLLLDRVRRARLGLDRFTCRKGAVRQLPYHGKTAPQSPLPFAAAEKRLMAYFPDCWKTLPPSRDRDALQKEIALEIKQYRTPPLPTVAKAPAKFAGKRYLDFSANYFEDHSHGKTTLVAAPDSEVGTALKMPVGTDKYLELPWKMGFYNTRTTKGFNWSTFPRPPGKGYQWYHLGKVDKLRESIMLLNNGWSVQLAFLRDEILDKPFDVWVSLKLEGKTFFPDSKEPGVIYYERVILVKEDEDNK